MNDADKSNQAASGHPHPAVKGFKPVKYIHEKGASFQTFYADGAWLFRVPVGIEMNFFVERPILAEGVISQVNPDDGSFTGEHEIIEKIDQTHFLMKRDFQASVSMTIDGAKRLRSVLDSFISAAEKGTK